MADASRFNFFNRLNARARIFVLVAVVVGLIFLVYIGTRFLTGTSNTAGPSRVAAAPQGLQNVPGGKLTAEYQSAITQGDIQSAQQAQMTGGSSAATPMNFGGQAGQAGCIICAEESANVKNLLDGWATQGKVAPDIAQMLEQLANKGVSANEYANALDRLVKEGKLTPEQARQLLDEYKKQHASRLLAESGQAMDDLIKSGALPLGVANELLGAQRKGMSAADYANLLQDMVRQGKISPEVAQQLLAQYAEQRAKEITAQSIATLHQMAQTGQITQDIETQLVDLENRRVTVDVFSNTLQGYITGGKIIPAVANKILDEFKAQKAAMGTSGLINQLLKNAEAQAYAEINDLLKAGKISQEVADQLIAMIQKNVPFADYQNAVNLLVQQNKLTPDIAKLKIGDYRIVKGLREKQQRLATLQANNATSTEYADELKRNVQAGIITPDQAAQLMKEYQAAITRPNIPIATGPGTEAFAQLQQRVQQGEAAPPPVPEAEFAAAVPQVEKESDQDRQARIEALLSAMSSQAQQLIAAWQPPTMELTQGSLEATLAKERREIIEKAKTTSVTTSTGAPLIKAGTILFSVLDTEANSDYPDSPILATIVEGPFKGAKLLGKLSITMGPTRQMDRIALNFTMMNMDQWPKSRTITAYAIDPDTARTVMASTVNHHYILRFGAMLATSLLQGYASAINTSSSTTTTGIFGTSTTHPQFSPSDKVMTALGQAGQTLGNATQNLVNTPPTVRVDPGVSLGILFMVDVT